jgi:hypothetical protein
MTRHSRKRTQRKKRGGASFYGPTGVIAPGALQWGPGSEMGGYSADQINAGAQVPRGGRRRRHRKTRHRRKTRGGGKFGGVAASFNGTGQRGMADYDGISTRVGPGNNANVAAGGKFNNFGAQPGSGHGSFNIFPK